MKIIPDPQSRNRRYAALLVQAGWTCHEPGTSCIGTSHSYSGKQETSLAASLRVAPKTGTQRAAVWEYLRSQGPATDPELQQELGLGPNSERPRRKELVDGGFVRDSGQVRLHHGEEHIVWEVIDHSQLFNEGGAR